MRTVKENLTFPDALKAAQTGELVTRKAWGSEFVFQRPVDAIPVQTVVDLVKSLPSNVKSYFKEKYKGETNFAGGKPIEVTFHAYLCKKNANDHIENGWVPDQIDMQTDDWEIVAPEADSVVASPADLAPEPTEESKKMIGEEVVVDLQKTKFDIKEFRLKFDAIAQVIDKHLIGELLLGPLTCKRAENAVQSLLLAKAWLGKMLGELGDPTPYANDGQRKSVADIEATDARAGEDMLKKAQDAIQGKNAVEAVDLIRQYIKEWVDEFKKDYHFGLQLPVEATYIMAFLQHAHEARFHLGFTLEALRESDEEEIEEVPDSNQEG